LRAAKKVFSAGESCDHHIYDSGARAKVLVETLQNYLKNGGWKFDLPANIGGETYYIIHPVLKHIAILDKGQSISVDPSFS
jgi:hypothetical protein